MGIEHSATLVRGRGCTADSRQAISDPATAALVYLRHRPLRSLTEDNKGELFKHRYMRIRPRQSIVRKDNTLLRQNSKLIQQQKVLNQESDHRLLNGLQMIVSLLSLQSRTSANSETASQLAVAANRVATIGRLHRHLHSCDGSQAIAFKPYLEELCGEYSTMLSPQECVNRIIAVEAIDIKLPSTTGIPFGFIVSELITNAAKYGEGPITVTLAPNPEKGYALSVSNDGLPLSEGFGSTACTGLGMKIIRSLVGQIHGELRVGPGDKNQGTQCTVLFCTG
jgi:two-component sensor histidine kinase